MALLNLDLFRTQKQHFVSSSRTSLTLDVPKKKYLREGEIHFTILRNLVSLKGVNF